MTHFSLFVEVVFLSQTQSVLEKVAQSERNYTV